MSDEQTKKPKIYCVDTDPSENPNEKIGNLIELNKSEYNKIENDLNGKKIITNGGFGTILPTGLMSNTKEHCELPPNLFDEVFEEDIKEAIKTSNEFLVRNIVYREPVILTVIHENVSKEAKFIVESYHDATIRITVSDSPYNLKALSKCEFYFRMQNEIKKFLELEYASDVIAFEYIEVPKSIEKLYDALNGTEPLKVKTYKV